VRGRWTGVWGAGLLHPQAVVPAAFYVFHGYRGGPPRRHWRRRCGCSPTGHRGRLATLPLRMAEPWERSPMSASSRKHPNEDDTISSVLAPPPPPPPRMPPVNAEDAAKERHQAVVARACQRGSASRADPPRVRAVTRPGPRAPRATSRASAPRLAAVATRRLIGTQRCFDAAARGPRAGGRADRRFEPRRPRRVAGTDWPASN